jgi:hypothetical protein
MDWEEQKSNYNGQRNALRESERLGVGEGGRYHDDDGEENATRGEQDVAAVAHFHADPEQAQQ